MDYQQLIDAETRVIIDTFVNEVYGRLKGDNQQTEANLDQKISNTEQILRTRLGEIQQGLNVLNWSLEKNFKEHIQVVQHLDNLNTENNLTVNNSLTEHTKLLESIIFKVDSQQELIESKVEEIRNQLGSVRKNQLKQLVIVGITTLLMVSTLIFAFIKL